MKFSVRGKENVVAGFAEITTDCVGIGVFTGKCSLCGTFTKYGIRQRIKASLEFILVNWFHLRAPPPALWREKYPSPSELGNQKDLSIELKKDTDDKYVAGIYTCTYP